MGIGALPLAFSLVLRQYWQLSTGVGGCFGSVGRVLGSVDRGGGAPYLFNGRRKQ